MYSRGRERPIKDRIRQIRNENSDEDGSRNGNFAVPDKVQKQKVGVVYRKKQKSNHAHDIQE